MTTYADPYLNQLAARIAAYEALVPLNAEHARDIASIVGKLQMQLTDQKASKAP
jgi:hypothetical protein